MKIILASLAGALMLTACGAPSDKIQLTRACSTLFEADAEMVAEFKDQFQGLTINRFCSCYGQSFADGLGQIGMHKDIFSILVAASEEVGGNVEDAAQHVTNALEAGTMDTFTKDQFDEVEDYLEDIAESMADTGQCPAPK